MTTTDHYRTRASSRTRLPRAMVCALFVVTCAARSASAQPDAGSSVSPDGGAATGDGASTSDGPADGVTPPLGGATVPEGLTLPKPLGGSDIEVDHLPGPAGAGEWVVSIVLAVDREGGVAAVDILEPLEDALDRRVRERALGLRFEPARRNGVPVAARIRYELVLRRKRATVPVMAAPPAALAPAPGSEGRLMEIVVRGKRPGGVASDPMVPSSVTPMASIAGEAAKSAGAKNAGEALLETPGVVVGGHHNQGDRFNEVRIRGFDPAYTLVLVDGERVTAAADDGRFDLSSVGIDQIDRIEVIKGPQALSYGSDAIGGVVNIVTRPPGDRLRLFGTAGYGALGTSRAGASAASPIGGTTSARIFARHERSDGFTDAHDLDRDLRQTTPRDDRRPTRKTEGQAEVWQELGARSRLRASARVFRNLALVERTSNRYVEQGAESGEDERVDITGALRADIKGHAGGVGVVSAQVFRAALDRTRGWDLVRQSGGRFLNRELGSELQSIRDTLFAVRSSWRQPLGSSNDLTIYTEGRRRRRTSLNDGRVQRLNGAGVLTADARTVRPERLYDKQELYGVAGVENELRFRSHALLLGVRAEDTSTWEGVVTPAASLRLGLGAGFDLRLAAGAGYRVPGFELRTQSPVPELDLLGTKYTAGNLDLRPERSRAGQIVLSQRPAESIAWALAVHGSLLRDRIEKAIEDNFMGTGLPLERPVNVGRAWTAGAEVDLRLQPHRYLGVRGSYSYLLTRNADTGARLNETPTHTASLHVGGHVRPLALDVSASYIFIGERPRIDAASGVERADSPVGALHLGRVRIGRRLPGGLRVDVDVDNALGARWDRDNDGDSDLPPLRLFASLSWLFEGRNEKGTQP